jgi:hypothetical protein
MCFSFEWVKELLIWLVIVCAVVAIIRILLPLALSQLGPFGGTIMALLNIIMWAFITVAIIVIACLAARCFSPAGTV